LAFIQRGILRAEIEYVRNYEFEGKNPQAIVPGD
jgi:hypothetical protein